MKNKSLLVIFFLLIFGCDEKSTKSTDDENLEPLSITGEHEATFTYLGWAWTGDDTMGYAITSGFGFPPTYPYYTLQIGETYGFVGASLSENNFESFYTTETDFFFLKDEELTVNNVTFYQADGIFWLQEPILIDPDSSRILIANGTLKN